ncbi:MAG TPA: hypothetical protein VGR62_17910 [Candidatus Binatia bacterium]|jgi:glucose-1-phosphate adenylyltransferase|nr:hypothetical protein [Candidatus Binatia bacterium]
MGRTVGVVVVGAAPDHRLPLTFLGLPDDVALAPFAVRHRVMDLALSTLLHASIRDVEIVVAATIDGLAAYRPDMLPAGGPQRLPRVRAAAVPDAGRLRRMLDACAVTAATARGATIVGMAGDHLLAADLHPLLATHAARRADVTLACIPVLSVAEGHGLLVELDGDGRITRAAVAHATDSPLAMLWTGDVVLRAGALPALLAQLDALSAHDDAAVAGILLRAGQLAAGAVAGTPATGRDAYWHDPRTVEAYYDAQMALCLPDPPLDLWARDWSLRAGGSGTTPAKVVCDVSGHPGHVLNTLLGDGTCVRGAEVVRSVLGAGVFVDAGAELEDCVLLDGCRVGRGARVRRAIVGVGALIGDGESVGYDIVSTDARVLSSGLTLVPPTATSMRPAAGAR